MAVAVLLLAVKKLFISSRKCLDPNSVNSSLKLAMEFWIGVRRQQTFTWVNCHRAKFLPNLIFALKMSNVNSDQAGERGRSISGGEEDERGSIMCVGWSSEDRVWKERVDEEEGIGAEGVEIGYQW